MFLNMKAPDGTMHAVTGDQVIRVTSTKRASGDMDSLPDQNGALISPDQNGALINPDQNGAMISPDQNGAMISPDQNGALITP